MNKKMQELSRLWRGREKKSFQPMKIVAIVTAFLLITVWAIEGLEQQNREAQAILMNGDWDLRASQAYLEQTDSMADTSLEPIFSKANRSTENGRALKRVSEWNEGTSLQLDQGRFPRNSQEILVSTDLLEEERWSLNQTIDEGLTIVGTYIPYLDQPEDPLYSLLQDDQQADEIYYRLKRGTDYHLYESDERYETNPLLWETRYHSTAITQTSMVFLVFTLAGTWLCASIMLVNFFERKREYFYQFHCLGFSLLSQKVLIRSLILSCFLYPYLISLGISTLIWSGIAVWLKLSGLHVLMGGALFGLLGLLFSFVFQGQICRHLFKKHTKAYFFRKLPSFLDLSTIEMIRSGSGIKIVALLTVCALLFSITLSVSSSWLEQAGGWLNRQDDLDITLLLETPEEMGQISDRLQQVAEKYESNLELHKTASVLIDQTLITMEAGQSGQAQLIVPICMDQYPLKIRLLSLWQQPVGEIELNDYDCEQVTDVTLVSHVLRVPESFFNQIAEDYPDMSVTLKGTMNGGDIQALDRELEEEEWPVTTPVYVRNHIRENKLQDQTNFRILFIIFSLDACAGLVILFVIYGMLSQTQVLAESWLKQQRILGFSIKRLKQTRMKFVHYPCLVTAILVFGILQFGLEQPLQACFISMGLILMVWVAMILMQNHIFNGSVI